MHLETTYLVRTYLQKPSTHLESWVISGPLWVTYGGKIACQPALLKILAMTLHCSNKLHSLSSTFFNIYSNMCFAIYEHTVQLMFPHLAFFQGLILIMVRKMIENVYAI